MSNSMCIYIYMLVFPIGYSLLAIPYWLSLLGLISCCSGGALVAPVELAPASTACLRRGASCLQRGPHQRVAPPSEDARRE